MENKKYYQLYVNRKNHELKLTLLNYKSTLYSSATFKCVDDSIFRHNNFFYFSTNKKELREYAIDIKKIWQEEIYNALCKIIKIKIWLF